MTLQPLYTEGNKPETVTNAEATRAVFLQTVSAYLAQSHAPALNDEQKQKVIEFTSGNTAFGAAEGYREVKKKIDKTGIRCLDDDWNS